jgi:NAD(P)-dependent dehydrogenase (short-subunit alcohol dehydrogenase family)
MNRFTKIALVGAGVIATYSVIRGLQAARTDLLRKVVVITGGSRGLGLALAKRFAEEGCRIVICSRDAKELEAARVHLATEGAEVLTVVCDVTEPDDVDHLIEKTRERFGGVDILVNNASIIQVAPLEELDLSDFEDGVNVNFWGTVHPTLRLLPELRERQGHIVNITSIGARVAVPHMLPYTCGKFAAYGFSEGLRAEAHKDGIRVTTVVPGMMRTGSPVNAYFKGHSAEEYGWFAMGATTPLTSISAERAARRIVNATKRGQALLTVDVPARLLRSLHDLAPGMAANTFGLVNRVLPGPNGDHRLHRGEEVAGVGLNRAISRPIDKAARKHHQYSGERLGPTGKPEAATEGDEGRGSVPT